VVFGKSDPFFVAIEGIDRCGKSLQAERLVERLEAASVPARLFSTPKYESRTGEAIVQYLAGKVSLVRWDSRGGEMSDHDALALQCLMLANRYEVASEIVSCLREGRSAVCVRWKDSAVLYGLSDGLSGNFVEASLSCLPVPDLNVLLDVRASEVGHRADHHNRYESDYARQERLSRAYFDRWRWLREYGDASRVVVPGNMTVDEVGERIWRAVLDLRPELFRERRSP